MANTPQRIVSGGNILPHRFVKADTSEDHQGLQADANAEILGVAGEETKYAPLEDLVTTNYHAVDGDPVMLRGPGEEALVTAGAAVAAGTLVKSDSTGRAVAVATTGTTIQNIGGRTQQAAAAAGELIRISVDDNIFLPAAS